MATLESYGKEVHSIFQLLGEKENDITLSISWALTKCPEFMKAVISSVCGVIPDPNKVAILNQKYDADTGITDIEVTDHQSFHIIFEAKRGWIPPGAKQLTSYSLRKDFAGGIAPHKHIVSLSECTQTYAGLYLPFLSVNGIPVSHLSYKEIYDMAVGARVASNHEQKHLLAEFCEYLRGL